MRSIEEVRLVLALVDKGLNDCEIERRTGIPRRTVLGWRHGRVPRFAKVGAESGCPDCGYLAHAFADLLPKDYAYLLGMYLGDGFVATHPRTYRLVVALDRRYQGIVRECTQAIHSVMPTSRASVYQRPGQQTDEVSSYSKAWPCLLPQHGPGKKHLRKIELVPWQISLVEQGPQSFLRGLIHSDGCRSSNVIRHPRKTYIYPRYEFTNFSADIRGIFCSTCDQLGIQWRRMNAHTISIARRESVAMLDRFIGPKR